MQAAVEKAAAAALDRCQRRQRKKRTTRGSLARCRRYMRDTFSARCLYSARRRRRRLVRAAYDQKPNERVRVRVRARPKTVASFLPATTTSFPLALSLYKSHVAGGGARGLENRQLRNRQSTWRPSARARLRHEIPCSLTFFFFFLALDQRRQLRWVGPMIIMIKIYGVSRAKTTI